MLFGMKVRNVSFGLDGAAFIETIGKPAVIAKGSTTPLTFFSF
jgi:hypothetical protein